MIIGIILAVVITTIAFSGQMQSAKQTIVSATADSQGNPQIPTFVLYDRMFRTIIRVRAIAETQRLKGERVTLMKTYFKDEAQLSDEENEILEQLATEFIEAVQPINDEAGELIGQIRETFPDGIVPNGEQVPPPPKELENLQNKRNDLALEYRTRLEKSLGNKFADFDNFMHGGFASNFQSVTPSSGIHN